MKSIFVWRLAISTPLLFILSLEPELNAQNRVVAFSKANFSCSEMKAQDTGGLAGDKKRHQTRTIQVKTVKGRRVKGKFQSLVGDSLLLFRTDGIAKDGISDTRRISTRLPVSDIANLSLTR